MPAEEELIPVRVASVGERPWLAWAEGDEFCLPRALLEESLPPGAFRDGRLNIPDNLPALHPAGWADLRLRRAFTDARPGSSRLPFSYARLPGFVRSAAARIIGWRQRGRQDRWAVFPRWPLDLSADFLSDLLRGGAPDHPARPAPMLLTHDLDSPKGLSSLVKRFLPLEEAVGARSTNFIVPCAWRIDHRWLDELRARGHAVGIHGYDHSNTTAFVDSAERRHRLAASGGLRRQYACRGYRSPSLLRTAALLADLAGLFEYDSSIPTSGGPFPVPNNGCATARPFALGGIRELPLSLPRDGSLRFLGHSPRDIARIWKHCAATVARSGGVAVLLTHCEKRFSGNAPMLNAYREFLDYVAATGDFAFRTPEEVLGLGPPKEQAG